MINYNFICVNNHHNYFDTMDTPPNECSQCRMDFDENMVIPVFLSGIRFICRKNGDSFDVLKTDDKIFLGRNGIGSEVFSTFRNNQGSHVISRTHCSVSFKDDLILLQDENSTNGTFVGIERKSCQTSPQIIGNDEWIHFGRELFLTELLFDNNSQSNDNTDAPEQTQTKQQIYQCRSCAHQTEKNEAICPNCESFGTIVLV